MSSFMLATEESRQPGEHEEARQSSGNDAAQNGRVRVHMDSASQAQCWNNRGWQASILPSSKPWLSRSCRLSHRSHPNLFLEHSSVWS